MGDGKWTASSAMERMVKKVVVVIPKVVVVVHAIVVVIVPVIEWYSRP